MRAEAKTMAGPYMGGDVRGFTLRHLAAGVKAAWRDSPVCVLGVVAALPDDRTEVGIPTRSHTSHHPLPKTGKKKRSVEL